MLTRKKNAPKAKKPPAKKAKAEVPAEEPTGAAPAKKQKGEGAFGKAAKKGEVPPAAEDPTLKICRHQAGFRRAVQGGGFPVWCCGMSSAGGCPGASLAAASETEPVKAPVSVRMCSQHSSSALARGSPEAMNSLYRSSDLAKSSPVPTASTRCSAKPGRIEPSSSGSSVVLLTVPNRFQNSFR